MYNDNEGLFVRLILNTVFDLSSLGIPVNTTTDDMLTSMFKQKPNIENTIAFFTHDCIISIWTNKFNGPAEAFNSSSAF